MFTYQDALNALTKARKGSGQKKLDHNTYAVNRGDHVAIRLHATDVVKLYPNGDVVLNSGGWDTVTTKDRISRFSPYTIQQKKYVWSIWSSRYNDGTYPGHRFIGLFKDGVRLNSKGKVMRENV